MTARKNSGSNPGKSLLNRYQKRNAPLDQKRGAKVTSSMDFSKQNLKSASNLASHEKKAEPEIVSSFASNRVKKQDLARSQVFSVKEQKPTTLIVNKSVDKEEALAGIALLNKHDQAMKRYQRSNSNAS